MIGAGIAGLAAAARLAHAGFHVTVLERHSEPGGKMRCVPSEAGPVDAGPTVLTLRWVLDALFLDLGERLEDQIELVRQSRIARHFWADGSTLDLFDDRGQNRDAIRAFAGRRAGDEFLAFDGLARKLFEAFDAPIMRSGSPRLARAALGVAGSPGLVRQMVPGRTLAHLLDECFSDPRLRQLFGRYATYVGGSPYGSPAILSLIWHAEAAGVWVVRGGMHRLAVAIAGLAAARGAEFRFGSHVEEILTSNGRATGIRLDSGHVVPADLVVFNGDPRALAHGALGVACSGIARQTLTEPRSLSAEVWAFAARPSGPELALHNVFFTPDPETEFRQLARGERGEAPTLYICAMDRAEGAAGDRPERFEIIANAPPLAGARTTIEDTSCRKRTFETLARFGLRFSPDPPPDALTTPAGFERLFPYSAGSLYGQSPHGTMAAFRRPTARTSVRGLYLAGGGVHPGPGIPMATLSGRFAAAAILRDMTRIRASTARSRPAAMPGGMSTRSRTTAGTG